MPAFRARVSAIHRGRIELLFEPLFEPLQTARQFAALGGSLRTADDPRERPCVGDWVLADRTADGSWSVNTIEPRTSLLVRRAAGSDTTLQPLAANVDVALLFAALPDDVNGRRLARLVALAWDGGAMPVVLISRADLCDRDTIDDARREVARHCPGVPVVAVSAHTTDGLAELKPWLTPGSTVALLGPSGAGKSTLVNALAGHSVARTGDISANGDGRHTTTHRELFVITDGINHTNDVVLIDTPGLREVGLLHQEDSGEDGVDRLFADIAELAEDCRYADCRHRSEPHCAVRAAVDAGRLDRARLDHWHELRAEVDRAARSVAERRRVERQGSLLVREFKAWRGDR